MAEVPVVIEATIGGVKVTPRVHFFGGKTFVAEFEVLAPLDVRSAVNDLGEKYDYVGLFGFLPVMIGRWMGKTIKNVLAQRGAVVCAELLVRADTLDAIVEWHHHAPDATTPEDLFEACMTDTMHFRPIGQVFAAKKRK